MSLDTPKQLPELAGVGHNDDAGVPAAGSLPFRVETEEITRVLGQDGPGRLAGVYELTFIGDSLAGSTSFLAAFRIVAATPQRPGQIPEDVLVGEDPDP